MPPRRRRAAQVVATVLVSLLLGGCERKGASPTPPPDAGAAAQADGARTKPGPAGETKEASGAAAEAARAAEAVTAACELLAKDPSAAPVPGAQEYLCKGVQPACEGLDQPRCAKTPLCFPHSGSGSGPGCVVCTPDVVFYGCEPVPKDRLAQQVLQKPLCLATHGQWAAYCDCGAKALFVAARGCVEFTTLCAEAGGEWMDLPPRSPQFSEFLPLAECQAKPMARWEPPPAPPLGLCEVEGFAPWRCDQAQRRDVTARRILKSYQEQAEEAVLCTYLVDAPPPGRIPYQLRAPRGTREIDGAFCRKDGRPHPVAR